MPLCCYRDLFFFFHYTATTEIYTYLHTLSLHDALPISHHGDTKAFARAAHQIFRRYANAVEIDLRSRLGMPAEFLFLRAEADARHILFDDEAAYALGAIVARDRKSTRLNSSH